MTPKDVERGEQLLQEEFVQRNPRWVAEVKLMLQTREKAEIRACAPRARPARVHGGAATATRRRGCAEALSAFGFQYLTDVYLPRKLREGDWI